MDKNAHNLTMQTESGVLIQKEKFKFKDFKNQSPREMVRQRKE